MISVVYFAWINPYNDWKKIIYAQMEDLVTTGLCDVANVYINLYSEQQSAIEKCTAYIAHIIPKAIISITHENIYEYPGIYKVWEIANQNPDKVHIILYFHSKGMSYNGQIRLWAEKALFDVTIKPWNKVVEIFEQDATINKIGMTPSTNGFIWFNFWWVRASYISLLGVEPIITDNRYYYEYWLVSNIDPSKHNCDDCYNLAESIKGKGGDPYYAMSILNDLKKYY